MDIWDMVLFHRAVQISVNQLSTTKDASATGTQTFSTKTLMGIDEVCIIFCFLKNKVYQ